MFQDATGLSHVCAKGRLSKYFWEDEGGEQGDPSCLLCSHLVDMEPSFAPESVMHPSPSCWRSRMMCVSSPPQITACHTHLERELWAHGGIRINLGKTHIFYIAGVLPTFSARGSFSLSVASRANYHLRTIQPERSEEFAGAHDTAISRVFNSSLDI